MEQILFTFAATAFCAFIGSLGALYLHGFLTLTKKNVSNETQESATVVGEKPHKRAPVYGSPEKAAMYEAAEGRPVPPQWKR